MDGASWPDLCDAGVVVYRQATRQFDGELVVGLTELPYRPQSGEVRREFLSS